MEDIDACRDCSPPPPAAGESGLDGCYTVAHKKYYVSEYYNIVGADQMKSDLREFYRLTADAFYLTPDHSDDDFKALFYEGGLDVTNTITPQRIETAHGGRFTNKYTAASGKLTILAKSMQHGVGCDNPKGPNSLDSDFSYEEQTQLEYAKDCDTMAKDNPMTKEKNDPTPNFDQASRCFMFEILDASSFDIEVQISGSGSGRNFLLGGPAKAFDPDEECTPGPSATPMPTPMPTLMPTPMPRRSPAPCWGTTS